MGRDAEHHEKVRNKMTTLEIIILYSFGESFFIFLPILIGIAIGRMGVLHDQDVEGTDLTYYDITHRYDEHCCSR